MRDEDEGGMGALWWGAGVVVLAIVAGLIYVLIRPGDDPAEQANPTQTTAPTAAASTGPASVPNDAPPATTTPPTGAASSSSVATGRACKGAADSQRPSAAPAGVRWEPLSGGSVPVSDTLGPSTVEGPIRSCYQRSPAGALLASSNMLQSAFTSTPAAVKVFTEQMTPGSHRAQIIADIQAEDSSGGVAAEPAGFRFGACTQDACQVSLLFFYGGAYAQYSLSMVWADGDWKFNGNQNIEDPTVTQEAPGGYVVWGPNS